MDLADIREIERKWQKKWEEHEIFQADPVKGKEKFFITVPYPYANAPLHVGHGRSYTIGDIIARYKRMQGKHTLFPMAFHISGTPISSISDQIRRGSEEKTELYREYIRRYIDDPARVEEILESFKEPYNVAEFFANKINEDFKDLGFSIDWRRKFHTGMDIYNKFVQWQYKHLKEKNLLTRGEYHVRYCLRHEQAAGEDDIKDGDTNPVDINEFVAIRFDFTDGAVLASTLRPETLYGATNLWVNPDATYVKIKWQNQQLYMSAKAFTKFQYQHDNVEKLAEMQGEWFLGKTVESPLGDELPILPAFFVDPDNASGFVYSEPSDAPYDYMGLKDLKKHPEKLRKYGIDPSIVEAIEPIKIITYPGVKGHHTEKIVEEMDIESIEDPRLEEATQKLYEKQFYNGKMNEKAEEFAGMTIKAARDAVKETLLNENAALIFYETSRKAECRAGGKIIVARVKDQWFLDYSTPWWKEKTENWLNEMTILPEKYKKRFYDVVDWLRERPCSRKRGLGTKLPFDKEWVIESLSDSTIYMAFYTIVHLINHHDINPEQLTPSFFDYVYFGKGKEKQVEEATGISQEILTKMREEFLYWYPVDLRHTAVAHLSNHLSFFIFHHLAIFGEENAPQAISLNEMLIREGQKMSKSKGNVILLRDIAEQYSADLFRLVISSAADLGSTLDWTGEKVKSAKQKLLKFVKLASEAIQAKASHDIGESLADKWFLSKFYSRLENGTSLLNHKHIREYIVDMFFKTMGDLRHYLERVGREKMLSMLNHILPDWTRALAPIIPHITEELWDQMGNEGFISLASWPATKEQLIDTNAEVLEEKLQEAVEDTREIMDIVKETPEEAIFIIAADWKRKALSLIKQEYAEGEQLDIGSTMNSLMEKPELRKRGEEISKIVQKVAKKPSMIPKNLITQKKEEKIFKNASSFLHAKTGLAIRILTEEKARKKGFMSKAKNSLPLKPGIVLQ